MEVCSGHGCDEKFNCDLERARAGSALPHVQANSQTFYLNPFTQQGGIPEALRLQGLYAGLADKGIVEISTTDPQGKNAIIRITRRAWRLLKKF